jgi:hypothetical protein
MGKISNTLKFSQLYTTDSKALQHILSNSYLYQKPAAGRYFLGRVVGPGTATSNRCVFILYSSCRRARRRRRCPQETGKYRLCMRSNWFVLITFYQRKIMVILKRILMLRWVIHLSFSEPSLWAGTAAGAHRDLRPEVKTGG